MMSIDIAVIDINSAISAMNSRNGSGNRAAVASEVRVSSGFKRAYVHNGRQAGGFRRATRQNVLRELRGKIARHRRSLRRHARLIATMLTAPPSATGNRSAWTIFLLPEQITGRRP
jgi:hypothetical protein